MLKKVFILFIIIFINSLLVAQKNYKIKFEFDNYTNDTLLLAYFYADRHLIKDTIIADENMEFIYSSSSDSDTLESGVYILLFFPEKEFIQFVVHESDPFFTVKGDFHDLSKQHFKGSKDNELFVDYLEYIKTKRTEANRIVAKRKEAKDLGQDTLKYDRMLEDMDDDVSIYQDGLVKNYADAVTTILINGNREIIIPDFEETGDELKQKQFYYYRDHYFDYIDMANPVTLKTPFFHNKLERYLDQLTVQMPDSIIIAVDEILEKMEPAIETWKFYVAHFLNKYGRMQIIGMDAVYVHMVDKYYASGRTPWADEETLGKIIDNADKLRPVLLGKIAPDVSLHTEDKQSVRIHDIESPYTVLMFWAPDCGHCKTSMHLVIDFNEKFKDKGVKTIGICTKHMDKTAGCWDFIKEQKMDGLFYNLADEFHRSRFQVKYNIRTTPQIFILDKDKKIILKRIAAEKLEEVMDQIIENEK